MAGRWVYELWYRYGDPPWVIGPRQELVGLVAEGRLSPGRAIDLGCGVGDNAIHLASQGFEVVGVDLSGSAIERARERAAEAGVDATFVTADFFQLPDLGQFDLVVDYGVSDDLDEAGRRAFRGVVDRLLKPDGTYLLWCFEWAPSRWERWLNAVSPFGGMAMAPGEVAGLYEPDFEVDRFASGPISSWPKAYAAYLIRRSRGGLHVAA